jgi:hypothetical protein
MISHMMAVGVRDFKTHRWEKIAEIAPAGAMDGVNYLGISAGATDGRAPIF